MKSTHPGVGVGGGGGGHCYRRLYQMRDENRPQKSTLNIQGFHGRPKDSLNTDYISQFLNEDVIQYTKSLLC